MLAAVSSRPVAGCWSQHRPGVFFIARADGSIDVWDLIDTSYKPSLQQPICAPTPLSVLSACSPTTGQEQTDREREVKREVKREGKREREREVESGRERSIERERERERERESGCVCVCARLPLLSSPPPSLPLLSPLLLSLHLPHI